MLLMRWTKNTGDLIELDELNQEEVQLLANQKLTQIEDIEAELGIHFVLLHNIMRDGIYEEYEKDRFRYIPGESLILDIKNKCLHYNPTSDDERIFYFKNYSDNWALRKDDLQLPF